MTENLKCHRPFAILIRGDDAIANADGTPTETNRYLTPASAKPDKNHQT